MNPHLILAILLALVSSAKAEVLLTRSQALALAFPPGARVEAKPVTLTASQMAQVQRDLQAKVYSPFCEFYQGSLNGKTCGWALLDVELGKHQPIDFLVALDDQARVKKVAVMTYRERYGGGVRQPGFTRQFENKTTQDPLKVGEDIDAVAGATISSKALSLGVRKACLLTQHLFIKKDW